jgi:hypothetical protein
MLATAHNCCNGVKSTMALTVQDIISSKQFHLHFTLSLPSLLG